MTGQSIPPPLTILKNKVGIIQNKNLLAQMFYLNILFMLFVLFGKKIGCSWFGACVERAEHIVEVYCGLNLRR